MNQETVIIDIQVYDVHYVNRAPLDVVFLCSAQPQQLYDSSACPDWGRNLPKEQGPGLSLDWDPGVPQSWP